MNSKQVSIKKVGLPDKEWENLAKKGYNIPKGNFSMVHVIKTLNHEEMMKHLDLQQKCKLLETLYSSFGLDLIPLPEGFYLEIYDKEKLNPLITFLADTVKNKDFAELNKYVQTNIEKEKGLLLTIN